METLIMQRIAFSLLLLSVSIANAALFSFSVANNVGDTVEYNIIKSGGVQTGSTPSGNRSNVLLHDSASRLILKDIKVNGVACSYQDGKSEVIVYPAKRPDIANLQVKIYQRIYDTSSSCRVHVDY